MPYTIPNEATAAEPDQAEPDSVDFVIITDAFARNGVISGCAVTAQSPASMTLDVASGTVEIADTTGSISSTTAVIGAATANPRFDLVVAGLGDVVAVIAGTPSSNPVFPAIPASRTVLAAVHIPAGVTEIDSTRIADKRIILSIALTTHAALSGVHHAASHTLASHSARAHSDLSDAPATAHHTAAVLADGSQELTADWDVGAFDIKHEDNKGVIFGTADDARIFWDESNLVLDPTLVSAGGVVNVKSDILMEDGKAVGTSFGNISFSDSDPNIVFTGSPVRWQEGQIHDVNGVNIMVWRTTRVEMSVDIQMGGNDLIMGSGGNITLSGGGGITMGGGDITMGDGQLLGVDIITFNDVSGTIAGIRNFELVDKAAAESITGVWTFEGPQDNNVGVIIANFGAGADPFSLEVLQLVAGEGSAGANDDKGFVSLFLNDSVAGQVEFARFIWAAPTVDSSTKEGSFQFEVMKANALTKILTIDGTGLVVANGHGIVVGHTAQIDFGAIAEFQVLGTGTPDSSMGFARFENNASGPDVRFLKSRGATIGANTIVNDGDTLGRFRFQGADGGDFNTTAAEILGKVDGSPSLNDIPGKIVFRTRTAGGSLTDKMTIDNAGNLTVTTIDGITTANLVDKSAAETISGLWNFDGKLGVGTTTVPHGGVGAGLLAFEGPSGSTSGPHMQFTTDSDNFPIFQILPWSHSNMGFTFDAYWDGGNWRGSSTLGSFQIYQVSERFRFRYGKVVTAGDAFTPLDAISIGPANGDVRIVVSLNLGSDADVISGDILTVRGDTTITGELELDGDLNHDGSNVGFFGTAPVAQAGAYTQTFSTADKTHETPTVGSDIGLFTDPPSAAEMALLRTFVNALKADHVDLAQLANAIIDDFQAYGLITP